MTKYLILILGVLTSCSGQENSSNYMTEVNIPISIIGNRNDAKVPIDIDQSEVSWKGTKITGKHEGVVSFKNGTLTFIEGRLSGGELTVDMQSIEITDIPSHETTARRNLLNHFMEEFAIQTFSTSAFTFHSVKYLSNKEMEITGALKIRGVSKSITINASQNDNVFTSDFSFNRFDWGIGQDGSWFAKRLVDEMIQLKVKLIITPD